jgi:hypothetical protein
MKRIGEIAARLVANPIELVAAANQSAAHEFDAPTPSRMEAEDEQGRAPQGVGAKLATGEEAGASYGKGKGPSPKARPSEGRNNNETPRHRGNTGMRTHPAERSYPPRVLRLASSRCLDTVKPPYGFPRPAVSRHLVLVRERSHQPTAP